MNLALIGPGAIGSTLAFQLSRAGHQVTVVARGERLRLLEKEQAIIRTDGERAAVTVCAQLDPAIAYDLVLVTVLATQAGAVLPSLKASRARKVMFLFNTFDSIAPLREAVGAQRFSFGFPGGIFCLLLDGRIRPTIRAGTTVDDPQTAALFEGAGIPTVIEPDMQSWLRTHAAFIVPLMAMGFSARAQGRGATWAEASRAARAMAEGFALVRRLGNAITPTPMRLLGGLLGDLPRPFVVLALWTVSRMRSVTDFAGQGPDEPRALIDAMVAAAPDATATLASLRP